jgi:hypothetical protein
MLIEKQVTSAYFSAGQTRTFSYPMTVLPGASGPGAITAWVESPGGVKIVQAIENILVHGYLIDFGGRVIDAENRLALPGVTIEVWNQDETQMVGSTTTDNLGNYAFFDIEVPVTLVFKYKKNSYSTVTSIPIPLGPSGGGLNIEMIPTAGLTKFVLYYTSPKTGQNSWKVSYLAPGQGSWNWRSFNYPNLLNFPYTAIPVPGPILIEFAESNNLFLNDQIYGPFLFESLTPGIHTWDASAETLDGVRKYNLATTANRFRVKGTVVSARVDTPTGKRYATLNVLASVQSTGINVGKNFIGGQMEVVFDPAIPTNPDALIGATADFSIWVVPLNTGYGQDFEFVAKAPVEFNYGYPAYFYSVVGNYSIGGGYWKEWQPFGDVNLELYSEYGIPTQVMFRAFDAQGVQRNLTFYEGITWKTGTPGTAVVEGSLPTSVPSTYWIGFWLMEKGAYIEMLINPSGAGWRSSRIFSPNWTWPS